ncbi:hypothetical protein CERSUDRAFT_125919 [Gelatoporia subvermispora B]|uniref:Uncharacterized protein n=1 Tax=Ceriporiopsis subvermispora (strain B) TaxID=914234 RepID=M2QN97_CERS8|nr:hypothetical protein CERSUDRAFT_125919 [Gelatoporia subvermispora B]
MSFSKLYRDDLVKMPMARVRKYARFCGISSELSKEGMLDAIFRDRLAVPGQKYDGRLHLHRYILKEHILRKVRKNLGIDMRGKDDYKQQPLLEVSTRTMFWKWCTANSQPCALASDLRIRTPQAHKHRHHSRHPMPRPPVECAIAALKSLEVDETARRPQPLHVAMDMDVNRIVVTRTPEQQAKLSQAKEIFMASLWDAERKKRDLLLNSPRKRVKPQIAAMFDIWVYKNAPWGTLLYRRDTAPLAPHAVRRAEEARRRDAQEALAQAREMLRVNYPDRFRRKAKSKSKSKSKSTSKASKRRWEESTEVPASPGDQRPTKRARLG